MNKRSRLVCLLREAKSLEEARFLHKKIAFSNEDTYLSNFIVHMYGKCGSLEDAYEVFQNISCRNVFSWNMIISAYAYNAHLREAQIMFDWMPRKDVVSWTTMITAYAHHGHLENARKLFVGMPVPDDVPSWNAMIAAYTQNGYTRNAVQLFCLMDLKGIQPNKITFLCILDSCSTLEELATGRLIHQSFNGGVTNNICIANSLVNMYGKCGSVDDAKLIFDKMSERDTISWTALISAYSHNGHGIPALDMFKKMDLEGIEASHITITNAIDACTNISDLPQGKIVHKDARDAGFDKDVGVATALVNLYGRCGNVENARLVFDSMPTRNILSWSSMISIYAQTGLTVEALELFLEMKVKGENPNASTFLGILSACVHTGLMRPAWDNFMSMMGDFGIKSERDHYVCMVVLLGRSGKLDEAEELMKTMPFEPDRVAWTAYLSVCKIHEDAQRGSSAADNVQKIEPHGSASYIMLSDLLRC